MADNIDDFDAVDESGAVQADESSSKLKLIMLGDSAVGKSKLVERFLMGAYQPHQLSTYALTLFEYNATINGKEIGVDIWDTAGQERFQSVHPSYYHRAHACILVFDVTRKVTYTNLPKWYSELRSYVPHIPVVVCANKIDVDLKATRKQFQFATKRNLPVIFTSAADGTNVVNLFGKAMEMANDYHQNPPDDFHAQVLALLDEEVDSHSHSVPGEASAS